MTGERDVLVVGAGFAGLACAERLSRARVNFLVLEGADRVGGRVLTDYDVAGGKPLEIGALMVHGKRVATHAWLAEAGLHARPIPLMQKARFWTGDGYVRFLRTSFPFRRGFGMRAFYQGVRGLPKAMQRYAGPDLSLAAFLDRENALPGARQLVTLLRAHAAAAEPDEVGVVGTAEEEALAHEEFGYSNFQVVEGYSELVKRRLASLQDRVRLRTVVTGIRRSPDGLRVQVSTPEGPGELRAKRVVVTVPLGVLKAGSIAFDPPLPEDKRRAIEAIGFGHAMVVQMRLRGSNLVERLGDFGVLWGETASTFHRPYMGLRDAPPVLLGFATGRDVPRRVRLPDAEVLDATLEELRSILPSGVHTGEVAAHAISRWSADPLVRGGYTFLPVNVGVSARRALAAPVDGTLFFAGEATHTAGEPATVHGAIETGHRAADEVLASLRQPRDRGSSERPRA